MTWLALLLAKLRARGGGAPRRGDAWLATSVALLARLGVVAFAASQFPPADDGKYYHVFAERLAAGLGYTWSWPDGAVTFAAHYPVGYPLLLAPFYGLFGPRPVVAMCVNAIVGSAAAFAAHRLAARRASRVGALVASLAVALHPSLVFYTAALMTEAVAGALFVIALAIAAGPADAKCFSLRRVVLAGLVLGVGVLVRPQLVLLAPLVPLVAAPRERVARRFLAVALGVAVTLGVCMPWTLRNCVRMERCVFVSANVGWNLLIGGSARGNGGWAPLDEVGVPEACRLVFQEAQKDECFSQHARQRIRENPAAWFALVPKKLSVTFDYSGAAAYYMHASNPALWNAEDKLALGIFETIWQRGLLLLGLFAAGRVSGPRSRVRRVVALGAALSLLTPAAWIGYLGLVVVACSMGRELVRRPSLFGAAAVVATTALVHAVFFGSGRYALVTSVALAALAGGAFPRRRASQAAARRGFDTDP